MLSEIFIHIQQFMVNYGALGVFLASFLEEIIAPIPSTLVVMGSSFIILKNNIVSVYSVLKLFAQVVLPASLGMTLGSILIYFIAYYAGIPFIKRWGKYLGLSHEDIQNTNHHFKKQNRDNLILFILRAVPVVPSIAISAFCGFIRFNFKNYLLYSFLGSLVRTTILGFIGWQFGRFYLSISQEISFIEELLLGIMIAGLIVYIIFKRRKNNQNSE